VCVCVCVCACVCVGLGQLECFGVLDECTRFAAAGTIVSLMHSKTARRMGKNTSPCRNVIMHGPYQLGKCLDHQAPKPLAVKQTPGSRSKVSTPNQLPILVSLLPR